MPKESAAQRSLTPLCEGGSAPIRDVRLRKSRWSRSADLARVPAQTRRSGLSGTSRGQLLKIEPARFIPPTKLQYPRIDQAAYRSVVMRLRSRSIATLLRLENIRHVFRKAEPMACTTSCRVRPSFRRRRNARTMGSSFMAIRFSMMACSMTCAVELGMYAPGDTGIRFDEGNSRLFIKFKARFRFEHAFGLVLCNDARPVLTSAYD
jgi:hypothetical protein